jgi:hypothetical protein
MPTHRYDTFAGLAGCTACPSSCPETKHPEIRADAIISNFIIDLLSIFTKISFSVEAPDSSPCGKVSELPHFTPVILHEKPLTVLRRASVLTGRTGSARGKILAREPFYRNERGITLVVLLQAHRYAVSSPVFNAPLACHLYVFSSIW